LPNLKDLPNDIYSLFEQDKHHEVSEENLERFCNNLKEVLRSSLAKQAEDREVLRFSSLGKKPRQLWYESHDDGTKEQLSSKTYFKFLYGHVIEALLLFLTEEAGHTVEAQQAEVSVDGVFGHIDAIVDGVVVDVKSASSYGFKKFEDGSILTGNDSFGYIEQLSGYASILTPDKPAAWIAMDKVSGDIVVTELPVAIIDQNKPLPRIEELKNVINQRDPPERCYPVVAEGKSGNMRLGTACSYCNHKRRCYPEIRTFLYSSGPKFLTKVVKEPNVFEI